MIRTVRQAKLGKLTLRLVNKDGALIGIALEGDKMVARVEGEGLDDVWRRLHDEAGKGDARFFGFDGARARFLKLFPGGFASEAYLTEERNYKIAAKTKLDAAAPVGAAATGSGFAEAVLRVFRDTNLVFQIEKSRIGAVLRSNNADAFIRAAARFALGGGAPALTDMDKAMQVHDAAKWTLATYLPYLWRPDAHMYLKPEVTKDFATRVGHPFASHYQAPLRIPVYESLLDLAAKTKAELADLKPRDLIDVQSFIWVVGNYRDGEFRGSS
jgi:hypothetical protein